MFDYFFGNEPKQYAFYSIPQIIFTDEVFKQLSCEAKVLYGIMLNKASLSLKSGWKDNEGRVYIYFKREEICEKLGCKKDKATKILNELDVESGIGLIKRINKGQGKPAIIYVLNFAKKLNIETMSNNAVIEEKSKIFENKTALKKAEKSPSEKIRNHENTIKFGQKNDMENENKGQRAENPPSDERINRLLEGGKTAFQKAEKSSSRERKNRLLEDGKTALHLISNNKGVILSNQSIYQSAKKAHENDGLIDRILEERKYYEKIIKDNIEYEWFLEAYEENSQFVQGTSKKLLDCIVETMLDCICSTKPIRVGKQEFPAQTVKSRLLKLENEDILHLFDRIKNYGKEIINPKAYLTTALYDLSLSSEFINQSDYWGATRPNDHSSEKKENAKKQYFKGNNEPSSI